MVEAVAYLPGRLKELRRLRGWTQEDLAAATAGGVGVACVRELEQGNCQPLWPTVVALCKALEVGPDALLARPGSREGKRLGRPRKDLFAEAVS